MAALEKELKKAEGNRFKRIATDGVFSMDGIIANLKGICELAEKYVAMVMVDDSHAVGFVGRHGRGSAEHAASKAAVGRWLEGRCIDAGWEPRLDLYC